MIHVTQGHEEGIGLEVFFKSLLYLSKRELPLIKLYADKNSVSKTIETITTDFIIKNERINFFNKSIEFFDTSPLNEKGSPQSTTSLLKAIETLVQKGKDTREVLMTLPTSKDQLIFEKKSTAGYTEFFRHYFNNNAITMVFGGPFGFTALLTDHIPLREVSQKISSDLIENKTSFVLEGLSEYFKRPHSVIFAGINPHAGEGGILGDEERGFQSAIKNLSSSHKDISFIGPLPGDTLHFESKDRSQKLFVYSYHDQGLPCFKAESGLYGVNISLGMPFLRLSVDHGTAFHLYGKNVADCRGCLYTLQQGIRVINDH